MTPRHPALMDITDQFSENNRDFYVAEHIEGETFEAILESTESHLPIERVRQWAIAICDALSYLHNLQPEPVLFSDLSPAHVMIDRHGRLRLIDFGTGKAWMDHFDIHIMWIRNPDAYRAVEVLAGEVCPQSDIYGLGATLHHALTGRDPCLEWPFSWEERPIQQFNPAVPDGLVAVVNRALAIEPSERFATADDMWQALEALG
jgi:serine/threonine protein kinase